MVTGTGVMVAIDTETVTEATTGTEVGTDMGIEDTEGTGIVDMVVIETEGMVATDMMIEVSVKYACQYNRYLSTWVGYVICWRVLALPGVQK